MSWEILANFRASARNPNRKNGSWLLIRGHIHSVWRGEIIFYNPVTSLSLRVLFTTQVLKVRAKVCISAWVYFCKFSQLTNISRNMPRMLCQVQLSRHICGYVMWPFLTSSFPSVLSSLHIHLFVSMENIFPHGENHQGVIHSPFHPGKCMTFSKLERGGRGVQECNILPKQTTPSNAHLKPPV